MTGIPDTLAELSVPIGSVKPYARNPRRGDVTAIRDSLARHGQYRPIVVNRRTSEVLAGNHTLRAARELGWEQVAVTFVDADEDEAARIVLVDNRLSDIAGYDDQVLADLLGQLPELDGTGYQPADLDRLLLSLGIAERAGSDTEPGPTPAQPLTQPGELIELGDHRLLCADSTDPQAVKRLMSGAVADALWTDPPYGVSYVGKTGAALQLANDRGENVRALLDDALAATDAVLAAGAPWYIAAPPGPHGTDFRLAVAHVGWSLHQVLVWVKDAMVLGHSDYHYRHEDIMYGWKAGKGRAGRGRHPGSRWHGDHAQTTVLEVPRPKASREHPTIKPIELIERCLSNSTTPGHLVLDPFAGAGSTLIAAENLGRRCCALEIDPGYCDVVVDRWQRHTGRRAERRT